MSTPHLLPLSAHRPEALQALVTAWQTRLEAVGEPGDLAALVAGAQHRRSHRTWRSAVVGRDAAALREALAGLVAPGDSLRVRGLVFLFPGHGAREPQLDPELLAAEPDLEALLHEVADAVATHAGWSPVDHLLGDAAPQDRDDLRQPVLFCAQAVLARWWRSRGVEPVAVVGHSAGEVAAAYVSGALSLDAAARLVVARGRAVAGAPRGRVVALRASVERVRGLIEAGGAADELAVAADNAPSAVAVCGEAAAIDRLVALAQREEVPLKTLAMSFAAHGPLMAEAADALAREVSDLRGDAPAVPWISTVDAAAMTAAPDAEYWRQNLREPVRLREAVATLVASGHASFLEVHPESVLAGSVTASAAADSTDVVVLPALEHGGDPGTAPLRALGRAYELGVDLRWSALSARPTRLPDLPRTPLVRELPERAPAAPSTIAAAAGSGAMRTSSGPLSLDERPELGDHVFGGVPVAPTPELARLLLEAGSTLPGTGPLVLRRLDVLAPLTLTEAQVTTVAIEPGGDPGEWSAMLYTAAAGHDQHLVARARLARGVLDSTQASPPATIVSRCSEPLTPAEHYDRLARAGLRYGPAFQRLRSIWAGSGEAVGELDAPHGLTVPVLDAAMQVLAPALLAADHDLPGAAVPVGFDGMRWDPSASGCLWSHAVARPTAPGAGELAGDIRVMDAWGTVVAQVDGLRVRVVEGAVRTGSTRPEPRSRSRTDDDPRAWLLAEVAGALGLPPAVVSRGGRLVELGLDSMTAVGLRERMATEFGVDVPAGRLLEAAIDDLVVELARAPSPDHADARDDLVLPLLPLQGAYLVGREGGFGRAATPAQYVAEFEMDELDSDRLQTAVDRLVARHDLLRAEVDEELQLRIPATRPPLPIVELDLRAAGAEEGLRALREDLLARVRGIGTWPLLEVRTARLPDGRARVLLAVDLLLADAHGLLVLQDELARLYADPGCALESLDGVLATWWASEQTRATGHAARDATEYWTERAQTMPAAPDLPRGEGDAGPVATFARHEVTLPAQVWDGVRSNAAALGVTPNAILLAAHAEAIARWSSSPNHRLVVTAREPVRAQDRNAQLVAPITRTVLLDASAGEARGLAGRARAVQRRLMSDLEHLSLGGVEVARLLPDGVSSTPDAVVVTTVLGAGATSGASLGEVVGEVMQTPGVALECHAVEQRDGLRVSWFERRGALAGGVAAAMQRAVIDLLGDLAGSEGDPESLTVEIPAEQLELRAAVNATSSAVPWTTLHTPVLAALRSRPDRRAVVDLHGASSAGEVLDASGRLAARLAENGVQPGDLVAIVADPSAMQVAAVLAVHRCGAAYVPVDPSHPELRRAAVLERSGARVALVQGNLRSALVFPRDLTLVPIDDDAMRSADPSRAPDPEVPPESLAYVIFTSGSTGVPKGVAIDHRGAANTVWDVSERVGLGDDDAVLGLSSLTFDLSVWDLFGSLACGATLVLPDPARRQDPAHWSDLVERHGVTVLNAVPGLLDLLADRLEAGDEDRPLARVRLAMASGDWIPLGLPGRLRALSGDLDFLSLGGATEASIWSIAYDVDTVDASWASIPYGRPLRNQTMHVLDEHLREVPEGVPGDLWIGGVGVAVGYHGDPELTAQSFVVHPGTGARLYRTGDRGRWTATGDIEFLGRRDGQVKLRGYRIELGELETALESHPAVRRAVAAVRSDGPLGRRLVTWVVTDDQADEMPSRLRAHLLALLPPYMLPAEILTIDELPLSSNGKVDRDALPSATPGAATETEPQDDLEWFLAREAGMLLGRGPLGRDDDFFALGGSSVLAFQLLDTVEREVGVRPDLLGLLQEATVARLAEAVRRARVPRLEPAP